LYCKVQALNLKQNKKNKEIILEGISVSEGLAVGNICIYRTELDDISVYHIEMTQISQELERYFSALNEVSIQFLAKQDRIARDVGIKHAEIYDAYKLILEDPFFQEEIPEAIKKNKENAESVIRKKLIFLEKHFESIDDEYLRERIFDIRGVSRRLIYGLMQRESSCDFDQEQDNILIARELTPVDAIHFQHRALKGIATEYGGKTSHAAILAHSLEIAAVVGIANLFKQLRDVRVAAIDGYAGRIILNPSEKTKAEFQRRIVKWEARRRHYQRLIDIPIPYVSGKKIHLMANINDESEIKIAKKYRAEGVGLYRTEMPFLAKERFLTEDEQFELYRSVLTAFPKNPVTIRLLDMGGDKFLPFENIMHEINPFLGWRSIRILLSEPAILRKQLRALYRASNYGNLRIIIPMVSSIEEIFAVKEMIVQVQKELGMQDKKIPLGIMIEVPSAAIEADKYLEEVDFASLGTNDLVQYTLAVDRNNEKVAALYQPLHSAVLALIAQSVKAGEKLNKEISICGEMAGDPRYVPLLVSIGIRNFSMHPASVPRVKNVLLRTSEQVINHLSKNYSKFKTTAELLTYLESALSKIETNHI
jgi:phosphotransferase system enzyme I (PtsI)